MTEAGGQRSDDYAAQFEAAQDEFIRLVESLSAEQWTRVGGNFPQRFNEEDEGRPVGVIAHHVAVAGPIIMARIQSVIEGRPLPPVDFRVLNADHAVENADAGPDEVLALLRTSGERIAAGIRGISESQLDEPRDTPAGPMTVAQRIERVLLGHLKMHQGSIQAAIS